MGKVISKAKNPFKNFNLESRAHKLVSQPKPTVAPRYERDQIEYERLLKEHSQEFEESLKKNDILDKRLKDVYVVSHDTDNVNIKQPPNPNRPLPSDRSQVQPFLYGIKLPEKVPFGKITLGSALEFITQFQEDPVHYNAKTISKKYHLAEDTVKNILKYYRVFEVYIPQERETKARFAGPSIPKVHVIKEIRKELPPPEDAKEKT